MASKVKNSRVFIVHHRYSTGGGGGNMIAGRYRVGAKNEKEAEDFLRQEVGKHCKVRVYYEVKNAFMPHGMVVREC